MLSKEASSTILNKNDKDLYDGLIILRNCNRLKTDKNADHKTIQANRIRYRYKTQQKRRRLFRCNTYLKKET